MKRKPSLLTRAEAARTNVAGTELVQATLDADLMEAARAAGISGEDGEDILRRINEIGSENRLDERWTEKPKALRRGLLVPALVNAIAIVAMAVGMLTLASIFRQRESAIASNAAVVLTAEGRLLQEIREQTDIRIREKDGELDSIRKRMESLETERASLAADFDSRLKAREEELRSALNAEIEAERQRLRAQGFAEAVIEERIREYERAKNAEYQAALARFRAELDGEKAAADARIAAAKTEYERSIASIAAERRAIQDQARAREAELSASLDERSRALEAERQAAARGLEAAKAELATLEARRNQDKAAEERIVGLYASVRQAMVERKWEEAAARIAALETYLSDPEVVASSALSLRREADLFLASSLSGLVRAEMDKAAASTANMIQQAELLGQARAAGARGDEALARGDRVAAATAYREAVSVAPELLSAYEFAIQTGTAEALARTQEAQTAFASAELLWAQGRMDDAVQTYDRALEYLPVSPASRSLASARIGSYAVSRAIAEDQASSSRAASAPMAAANSALSSGSYAEAASAYARILQTWPRAEQAPSAFDGINRAVEGLRSGIVERAGGSSAELDRLRTEAETLKADLARSRSRASESEAALASARTRIGELESSMESLRKENATLQASLGSGGKAPATDDKALQAELASLREERDRLSAAGARIEELQAAFTAYAAAEDAARAANPGQAGILAARTELDAFLGSERMRAVFPDLRERFAAYEQAWLQAGQREVVYTAIDILEGAQRFTDATRRGAYLDDLLVRYSGNAALKDFIETVRRGR